MERFELGDGCALVLERGDLTRSQVDAIVNAANPAMLGGGGVDGAIHRAAGRRLLEACRKVPADSLGVRCPTGEARITPGFDLPARFVIHTVGPVYRRDGPRAPALLASAHRSSLRLARDSGLKTIAFPAISCGAYGYPFEEAAAVAISACREACAGLTEVRFVHFGQGTYDAWLSEARRQLGS